jgi:urease accessory protein
MTSPAQLLAVMQLSDSLFPTGAFTHSNGLETYVQHGTVQEADGLYALLAVRLLHGAARSDMVAVHSVMSARDPQAVQELDERLSAMKTARESREASIKVGKQMLRSALALLDDAALNAYQQMIGTGQCAGHHAIVHGLVYAAQGIDAQTALLAFAYGQTAGQISAAVKLMPIGQTQAQQVLYALIPTMQQAVETALAHRAGEMQSFTPALEIHMMQHQYLFRRLFSS